MPRRSSRKARSRRQSRPTSRRKRASSRKSSRRLSRRKPAAKRSSRRRSSLSRKSSRKRGSRSKAQSRKSSRRRQKGGSFMEFGQEAYDLQAQQEEEEKLKKHCGKAKCGMIDRSKKCHECVKLYRMSCKEKEKEKKKKK